MSTALAAIEDHTTLAPVTPMTLIERALAAGASIEQVEKLIALQERWEANEAKKAFNRDFAAFKAESIAIVKNITVTDGPLKGKAYADLYGVVSVVTPVLSRHHLSHSWKLTKDDPAWIEVTCTIRHELGYSESASMGAAPDTGPGRNAIQARVSTKTYLERNTLLAATGLAAQGMDTDGNVPGKKQGMPEAEVVSWTNNIEAAQTEDDLKKYFNAAYKEAQRLSDKVAMGDFIKVRDKRKAEIYAGR